MTPRRHFLRALCIGFAALASWHHRFLLDPDGICYVDIAKFYLRGDWHSALNSYWSPLFSWLIAAAFGVFEPSMYYEIPLVHAVILLAFVAGVVAWEWLIREWERWQGPPAHPALIEAAGYATLFWAGKHLQTLVLTTPDVLLIPIFLAATAILVRVRSGTGRTRDAVLLGLLLGSGFLAKAAFLPAIPLFLLGLAACAGTWRDRRIAATAATASILLLPFVAAVSIERGRLVLSDAGRLNYSWVVDGYSVTGYKEGVKPQPAGAAHPARVAFVEPLLLSYDQRPVGTIPAHFDPSWWSEGYPVEFEVERQWLAVQSGVATALEILAGSPALILLVLVIFVGSGRGLGSIARATWLNWWLWAPACAVLSALSLVYVQERYLAGAATVLAFSLIASIWHHSLGPWRTRLTFILLIATVSIVMVRDARTLVGGLRELAGRADNENAFMPALAQRLCREGMSRGDKVAIIGDPLAVPWLALAEGQVIATVPASIRHDEGQLERPLVLGLERPTAFWRADPVTRNSVLETAAALGATFTIARQVPDWADMTGWVLVSPTDALRVRGFRPGVYLKKLVGPGR